MRYSKVIVLALSTAIVVVGGCSSDDDDGPTGGKGGKGGTAGKAGSGGKGGSGGAKGGAGGAKAGNGGKGGFAAEGGKGASGGRGGVGGKAGTSGKGGNGGDAGACIDEVAAHPLGNSCGNADEATVSTECTFVDTCKALGCGKPFSDFDASGCRRPTCDSSDQCDNGERCVPGVLRGEGDCSSSVYEKCEVNACNTCSCIASSDCVSTAFCLAAAEFPPSGDCNLTSLDCGDLQGFANELAIDDEHFEDDTKDAIQACQKKVSDALDTCNGVGGAGAGGQSGNGGQAGH